jgi:hypothetical protein
MFGALGLTVERLARVAYGGVELGELRQGKWRFLTHAEIGALHAAAEGTSGSTSRRERRSTSRATTRERSADRPLREPGGGPSRGDGAAGPPQPAARAGRPGDQHRASQAPRRAAMTGGHGSGRCGGRRRSTRRARPPHRAHPGADRRGLRAQPADRGRPDLDRLHRHRRRPQRLPGRGRPRGRHHPRPAAVRARARDRRRHLPLHPDPRPRLHRPHGDRAPARLPPRGPSAAHGSARMSALEPPRAPGGPGRSRVEPTSGHQRPVRSDPGASALVATSGPAAMSGRPASPRRPARPPRGRGGGARRRLDRACGARPPGCGPSGSTTPTRPCGSGPGSSASGRRSWTALAARSRTSDLVLVATPAHTVAGVMDELARTGRTWHDPDRCRQPQGST